VNAKHFDGGTPLLLAAMNGQTDCVRELVRAGVDVESTDNDGGFALAEAAGCEISSCVEVLVAAGCNLDRRIVETGVALEGGTSLMLCARYGLDAAVAALISAGADIEAKSNAGRTALMEAARWGRESYDCARMLLDAGADPMAVDEMGATAEDLARANPDANAAELMVGLLNVFKERIALGICVRQASSSGAKRM
jgi:ankyrin repeat protein